MEVSDIEEAVLGEYRLLLVNIKRLSNEIEDLIKVGLENEGVVPLMMDTLRALEVRIVLVNQMFKAATYSVYETGDARPKQLS